MRKKDIQRDTRMGSRKSVWDDGKDLEGRMDTEG